MSRQNEAWSLERFSVTLSALSYRGGYNTHGATEGEVSETDISLAWLSSKRTNGSIAISQGADSFPIKVTFSTAPLLVKQRRFADNPQEETVTLRPSFKANGGECFYR